MVFSWYMEAAQQNQGQGAHSFPLLHLPSVLELSDRAEGESLRPGLVRANPSTPGLEKTSAGMRLANGGPQETEPHWTSLMSYCILVLVLGEKGRKITSCELSIRPSVLNRYEGGKSDEKNWFTVLQILTNGFFLKSTFHNTKAYIEGRHFYSFLE